MTKDGAELVQPVPLVSGQVTDTGCARTGGAPRAPRSNARQQKRFFIARSLCSSTCRPIVKPSVSVCNFYLQGVTILG